jgi:hypothetical protein
MLSPQAQENGNVLLGEICFILQISLNSMLMSQQHMLNKASNRITQKQDYVLTD